MAEQPITRISPENLDTLVSILEVEFVGLAELLVSPGHRFDSVGGAAPGIHYNLFGSGKAFIGDHPPITLKPHTLVIVPANTPFRVEIAEPGQPGLLLRSVHCSTQPPPTGNTVRRFVVGDGEPAISVICGYFHASYGGVGDLFETLTEPIVEQFSADDHVDFRLKAALSELVGQEAGTGTMAASLLKQVLVILLRRSLVSLNHWVEQFSMLRDPRIAQAFAAMVTNPGADHSTHTLAKVACMSRSAFMKHFNALVGRAPMSVLRDLRMRAASFHLMYTNATVDQISRHVGYANTTSFIRAFKKFYDKEPSTFREEARSTNQQRFVDQEPAASS